MQKFSQTLIVLGAGVGVCALLILPPWPLWNKNPIKWQTPKVEEKQKAAQVEAPKKKK